MDVKNKKTALGDDAEIYTYNENMSTRDKLKGKSIKEKWEFFKQYYLLKVLGITIAAVFVLSLILTVVRPRKQCMIYVVSSDNAVTEEEKAAIKAAMTERLITNPKKQEIIFDDNFYFLTDEYRAYQRYMVYNTVGQITVSILPEEVFRDMVVNNQFKPISDVIPSDLFSKLADKMAISATKDEDGNMIENSEKAYGLILNDCPLFKDVDYSENVVLAVNSTGGSDGAAKTLIDFLFNK